MAVVCAADWLEQQVVVQFSTVVDAMDHGGRHRDDDDEPDRKRPCDDDRPAALRPRPACYGSDEPFFWVTVDNIPFIGLKTFVLKDVGSTVKDVKSLIRGACREAGFDVRNKQFQLLQCPRSGQQRYKHRSHEVPLGEIPADVPGELHFKYTWAP